MYCLNYNMRQKMLDSLDTLQARLNAYDFMTDKDTDALRKLICENN